MGARQELLGYFESMNREYWLMGTMPTEQTYPASFFTYLCEASPYGEFYDNKPCATIWTFGIGFYSNNPLEVESVPNELIETLKAAGWIVPDRGEDVQSDEPTHTGRRFTAQKIVYNYGESGGQ